MENVIDLCIISSAGQICDQCHSPSSWLEDSFQSTFAPNEKPAHQPNPNGLSHQMHRVLQGNLLEKEGYHILIKGNSSSSSSGIEREKVHSNRVDFEFREWWILEGDSIYFHAFP